MKNEMDLEEFVSIGWVIMKPFYLKDQSVSIQRVHLFLFFKQKICFK
jgi:hypothetical protein